MAYNGWTNYETWNVALWIGNDEGLYYAAVDYMASYDGDDPYEDFVDDVLAEILPDGTPDGVAWDDDLLDIAELDDDMRTYADTD